MDNSSLLSDFSLKSFNTFHVDVKAKSFASFSSVNELETLLDDESDIFLLGGGSNLLLTKDLDCLVLKNEIFGIHVIERMDDAIIVKCGGGELWHDFVMWCVALGYGGVENLSLIPGCVGTAPIQNIGAYGVELKDVMVSLEAFNLKDKTIRKVSAEECEFGYRDSIFKNKWKNQYCITSVTFKLSTKNHKLNLDYGNIKEHLENLNIDKPNIKNISDAVIAIRQSKLPDPEVIGNSGSFFKNPIVSLSTIEKIKRTHPDVKYFDHTEGQYKIPAAWLIDKLGLKGTRSGDAGMYENHALVLVNHGNASGQELIDFAMTIKTRVKDAFGIDLTPEVNVI